MRNKKTIFLLILGSVSLISGVLVSIHPNEDTFNDQGFTSDTKSSHKDYSVLGERSEVVSKSPHFAKTAVKIVKVLDGDTVQTETGEKIRYIGINSPEKGEPFSREATEANKLLVLGKKVRFEFDVQRKDRFGRTLAYVFADDTFVNLEMVKSGWAVLQTIPPNVRYQDKIVEAQKEARDNCLGTWANLCKDEKLKPPF